MNGHGSVPAPFPEAGWFEALRGAAAADDELAVIGRWCTLDLAFAVDKEMIVLRLREGRISEVIFDPDIGSSWSVTLRGTREDWRTFLQPTPPPFYSDLLAINSRVPSFSIEGDRKTFVRHLRALGRLFEIARRIGDSRARVRTDNGTLRTPRYSVGPLPHLLRGSWRG